jgi:hypothetical protein
MPAVPANDPTPGLFMRNADRPQTFRDLGDGDTGIRLAGDVAPETDVLWSEPGRRPDRGARVAAAEDRHLVPPRGGQVAGDGSPMPWPLRVAAITSGVINAGHRREAVGSPLAGAGPSRVCRSSGMMWF